MVGDVLIHAESEPGLREAHCRLAVLKVGDAPNPQVEVVLCSKVVSVWDPPQLVQMVR